MSAFTFTRSNSSSTGGRSASNSDSQGRAAAKAYSRAWDERARRALLDLLRDADQRSARIDVPVGRRVTRSLPGIFARRVPPVTSDR